MFGVSAKYVANSLKTKAYWKYAFGSASTWITFFAILGGFSTAIDFLSYFKVINEAHAAPQGAFYSISIALVIALLTRWPISRISIKAPNREITIEVIVGNLFDIPGQKVIGTNTTFDTDLADNLISTNSIQGQFTEKYYPNSIRKLNADIDASLGSTAFTKIDTSHFKHKNRKNREYDFGTTAKIILGREIFYLVSMAKLNESGTTETDVANINAALQGLWDYISRHGEKQPVVIPLLGTGKGRLPIVRKKMIERHAQSFINATKDRIFSSKLTIVIWPEDAKDFEINLFQIKDYLAHALEY